MPTSKRGKGENRSKKERRQEWQGIKKEWSKSVREKDKGTEDIYAAAKLRTAGLFKHKMINENEFRCETPIGFNRWNWNHPKHNKTSHGAGKQVSVCMCACMYVSMLVWFCNILTARYSMVYIENEACPEKKDFLKRQKVKSTCNPKINDRNILIFNS